MKSGSNSIRSIPLRNASYTSRDRQFPPLLPSSIATSSRVRLPPPPLLHLPNHFISQRCLTTSTPLRSPSIPDQGFQLEFNRIRVPKTSSPGIVDGLLGAKSPDAKRSIYSSSPVYAQPYDGDIGAYDDHYSNVGSGYDSAGDLASIPPFTAEEIAALQGGYKRGERAHRYPPPSPPSGVNGKRVEEYEPTEADFEPQAYAQVEEDVSWADGYMGDMEDVPKGAVEWEEASQVKIKKKRMRRVKVSDLPVLEAVEGLGVGEERYDWRKTALSQIKRDVKGKGKERWFPHLKNVRRERVKVERLKEGDKFYEEVKRYEEHFLPLLEAERKEEKLAHAERQLQWSHERLLEDGQMMDELGATPFPVENKSELFVYTFNNIGKSAAKNGGNLVFHKFTPGTITEICRTHPHFDFVKVDGTTNIPPDEPQPSRNGAMSTPLLDQGEEKLLGSVYSVTQKYIRVAFNVAIEGIESGKWRLDVGCQDFAYQRQLEAISLLHADPTAMERNDARVAASRSRLRYYVSPSKSDEDEAFNEPVHGRRIDQTVLQGTNLRDKTLRAFQEEFIPYDTSASLRIAAQLPVPKELHPGDIDATPIPPPHPVFEPSGVLAHNELIASWTKRYRADDGRPPVRVEGDPKVPLNPTQMRAIAMMLSERLSLVQGPPGTGKTRVIIETIKLLKHHWKIPHPILVTAHTNAAVDNLLSGLRDHGVKAARVGREEVVRKDLGQWTVQRLREAHPFYERYEEMEKEMSQLQAQMKELNDGPKDGTIQDTPKIPYGGLRTPSTANPIGDLVRQKIALQNSVRFTKQAMIQDVLLDADVICTTCLSAANKTLDGIDFPLVFLDEASMATEPLTLVPLMRGSSHVAIIGDHKQLPPVIISEEAQVGGLATSMFERLIHEHNIPSIMLDTQYRMHPQIAAFPNKAFYASALTNGTANPDGTVRSGFTPPKTDFLVQDDDGVRQNVTFVHHDSPEDPSSRSVRNKGESGRVCDVVADLLLQNPELSGSDIGIITPYAAQIRQLSDHLRTDSDRRRALIDLLGKERSEELDKIEIKTVDGFEGREKAVIIFSTVRNNPGGYIGFLADWRRLNVGLTRAKRALIMIGSADHLAKSKVGLKALEVLPSGGAQVWRDLIAWLDREGLILREDEE